LEVDVVAAAVIGGAVISAGATAIAGSKAASAQKDASIAGTAETRYQFDQATKILKPYTDAGTGSLMAQQDLLGLNGPEAQKAAIASVQSSPEFDALIKQGEEGILQNASATGGLRGGNTQDALAKFRPTLLSQLIQQKFSNLSGLTQMGQASAAGQASAGVQTGSNVASLMQSTGQAQAGAYLAGGQAVGQIGNSLAQAAILKKVF